jgi:hypothetical protein
MRLDQVRMQSLSEHQFMDSLFCFGENLSIVHHYLCQSQI